MGTTSGSDGSFSVPGASLYDTTMVRDGSNVWIGWFAYGSTAATTGVFVRQILPTLGSILKAPGSSQGTDTLKLIGTTSADAVTFSAASALLGSSLTP